MIAFLFVDIFDTSGTLYSVGRQAGYVDENDVLHNSDEASPLMLQLLLSGLFLEQALLRHISSPQLV